MFIVSHGRLLLLLLLLLSLLSLLHIRCFDAD
jgi:hypothetical protein